MAFSKPFGRDASIFKFGGGTNVVGFFFLRRAAPLKFKQKPCVNDANRREKNKKSNDM